MKIKHIFCLVCALLMSSGSFAFSSDGERVNHYLSVLNTQNSKTVETMLSRLQWAGLSDTRLFDEIEGRLLEHYKLQEIDRETTNLMAHHVRALAYSGNEKYRSTLHEVEQNASASKLRKHAKKALRDLELYIDWNRIIRSTSVDVAGKDPEVATYLKMLRADNVHVKRLAARAIFHEKIVDADLIVEAANNLKSLYLKENLNGQAQDTAAWLCKAIAHSADPEHKELLRMVGRDSPYKKIRKYARKYAEA